MKIFLSPANHYKNYAIKGYNEKQQMDLLAPLLKRELETYEGVEAIITKVYADTRQYDGRPEEARDLKADIYLALHTNASGMSATGGTAAGACGFYHPHYQISKDIATAIVQELNTICPIKSNRATQPAIYGWDQENCNLGELRVPASYGIPPVLIEHEFHDRYEGAKWIIQNLKNIAEADARGIAKVLKLRKKDKTLFGDINADGEVDNLDASLALQYDAGLIDLSEDELKRGDVNLDGAVDNLDASIILQHDAGLLEIRQEEPEKENIEIRVGEWEPKGEKTTYDIGEKVQFLGGYHYTSSIADKSVGIKHKPGPATIFAIASLAAAHRYCVIHTDDTTTVCGWVDATSLRKWRVKN